MTAGIFFWTLLLLSILNFHLALFSLNHFHVKFSLPPSFTCCRPIILIPKSLVFPSFFKLKLFQVFLCQQFFFFHPSNYYFLFLRILLLFVSTHVLIHSHPSITIILSLSLMHFKTLKDLNLPQIAQSCHRIYSYLMAVSCKCFLPPRMLSNFSAF